MKKIISLLVISILVGLSNASANNNSSNIKIVNVWVVDKGNYISSSYGDRYDDDRYDDDRYDDDRYDDDRYDDDRYKNNIREKKEVINSERATMKAEYKKTYEKKFGKMINRLDAPKAQILINKIDALSEKINNNPKYSNEIKEKFTDMLTSLRELVEERLNQQSEPQLDIDSLFR